MLIVAVDPGGGTGFATYETTSGEFYSGEEQGFADACREVERLLELSSDTECVAESYIVTERTAHLTQQTEPLRLLGVTEWECIKHVVPFKLQQPSARKPATDSKLKVLGWYKKTKDMHANDASKHLLIYCLKNKLLTESDMRKLKESLA